MAMTTAQMTTAAPMNIWDVYWGLRVDQCPCDVHFVEWLEELGLTGQRIFHFGTGGHHYVGIRCAEPELASTVLGITASPKEYDAFVKLATQNPTITKSYSAYFGDIYTSNARLLPRFDVVTLFHSCEFRSEANDAYGALTDREVMDLFTAQTDAGGYLLFYTGSFAYATAEPIIAAWAAEAPVAEIAAFKTLRVFRKTG
jgi:hypothetical protein